MILQTQQKVWQIGIIKNQGIPSPVNKVVMSKGKKIIIPWAFNKVVIINHVN